VIRISLTESDLVSTRIAASPLWETIGSLLLLREAVTPWPYDRWANEARHVLASLDTAGLAPVLGSRPCLPDSFLPAPEGPADSVEDELERVNQFSPTVLRDEMMSELTGAVIPADLAPFFDDPVAAVDRFTAALNEFWLRALAPHWPLMRSVLEHDTLCRARDVAQSGSEAVFLGLHPRISWRRPVLEIDKRYEFDLAVDGRGLVFVPLVFSRAALLVSFPTSSRFAVSYPTRGVGTIWGHDAADTDQRLESLVGRGRASVLRQLDRPRTTLELAARLGISPSTVSHHLSVLRRADLLDRRRMQKDVYYALNDTGQALTGLFGISKQSYREARPALDSAVAESFGLSKDAT
jgi:DNA-binding transcriptional ArsR family regulator